jgi:hypothetical protein
MMVKFMKENLDSTQRPDNKLLTNHQFNTINIYII